MSCTGAQFCGVALIETKNRALAVVAKLEAELDIPRMVRIHWTGCPNSCAQAQVGDIGLMGAPAKVDGKAVEGVRIMLGGTIGENPQVSAPACSRSCTATVGRARHAPPELMTTASSRPAPPRLQLAADFEKSVPCDEAYLLPKLRNVLIEHFGAVPKA